MPISPYHLFVLMLMLLNHMFVFSLPEAIDRRCRSSANYTLKIRCHLVVHSEMINQ